jgi:hypothetical protein
MHRFAPFALAASLVLLSACQRDAGPAPADAGGQATASPTVEPQTALGRTVAKAMDQARRKLHEEDLGLNGNHSIDINGKRITHDTSDLPPADITPQGELRIDGRTIATDEEARSLALAYRRQMIAIAETGMDLGIQGADLGMRAAGDAIASIFRGDTAQTEQRLEAEAKRLEAAASRLCLQLPDLLAAQDALAAKVPEFRPYARMTRQDVEDCNDEDAPGSDPADSALAAAPAG